MSDRFDLMAPRTGRRAREPGAPGSGMLRPHRMLAQVLQEMVAPEALGEWLLTVISGRAPNADVNDDGTPRHAEPPSWEVRMQALKIFLDRGFGTPVQMIAIQAMIQSAAVPSGADVGAVDLDALDDEELAAYERALAKMSGELPESVDLPQAAPRAPAAPQVLDAVAVEVGDDEPEAAVPAPPAPFTIARVPEVAEHKFASSAVAGAKYDAAARYLEVEFPDGTRWGYRNVEPEQWRAWLVAPSAGAWFHREVRNQAVKHPGQRVHPPALDATLPPLRGPEVL